MKASFRLGTLFGIPIQIHFTFLLILVLFSWFFATLHIEFMEFTLGFGEEDILLPIKIILGVLVSILFFFCILLHELAHSLVARRHHYQVNGITLFIFGGVSQLEEIPRNPSLELKIALAGPAVSILLAALFYLLAQLATLDTTPPLPLHLFGIAMGTLSFYNTFIGLFNLIPAFPVDGGRVLRALFAKVTDYGKATRNAALIGKGIAIIMAIIGIFYNIWLTLIAIFIYMGASQEEKAVEISIALEGITVQDIMTSDVITVPSDMSIDQLAEDMLKHRHMGYPVMDGTTLKGIVTFKDIHGQDKKQGMKYTVKDIMTTTLVTVSPTDPAINAFKIMAKNNIGRLIVLQNNEVKGIISRSDLLHAIKLKEAQTPP